LVFVDLQYDFTCPGGACFAPRPCVEFVRTTLFPLMREKGIKACEITSDYRQPRPGDARDCCRPGEWGYRSEVPIELVHGERLVKSMNSPLWTREGIGDPQALPGAPFQDPVRLDAWIRDNIGGRGSCPEVVLAGLTLDACVLCAAQELTFRGYKVSILEEATDTRSGRQEEKRSMLRTPPVAFWSKGMDLETFASMCGDDR